MSSSLKDARWQLAEKMAADDRRDFYSSPHAVKSQYLRAARNYLVDRASGDEIAALAAEFRRNP